MELRTVEDQDGGTHQGFVCYSLGNFISSQNYDLTDTTVALTLELTKDHETGITEVTGFSYTPLFMLDREEGASPRFELVDVYAALASGEASQTMEERLRQVIEDCHTILGPEHDAGSQ